LEVFYGEGGRAAFGSAFDAPSILQRLIRYVLELVIYGNGEVFASVSDSMVCAPRERAHDVARFLNNNLECNASFFSPYGAWDHVVVTNKLRTITSRKLFFDAIFKL